MLQVWIISPRVRIAPWQGRPYPSVFSRAENATTLAISPSPRGLVLVTCGSAEGPGIRGHHCWAYTVGVTSFNFSPLSRPPPGLQAPLASPPTAPREGKLAIRKSLPVE